MYEDVKREVLAQSRACKFALMRDIMADLLSEPSYQDRKSTAEWIKVMQQEAERRAGQALMSACGIDTQRFSDVPRTKRRKSKGSAT